jgi:hypothetical protein
VAPSPDPDGSEAVIHSVKVLDPSNLWSSAQPPIQPCSTQTDLHVLSLLLVSMKEGGVFMTVTICDSHGSLEKEVQDGSFLVNFIEGSCAPYVHP